MNVLKGCLLLFTALNLQAALAANIEIRALYQMDPTRPGKTSFINKTPNSGYCQEKPGYCGAGTFSLRMGSGDFGPGPIEAGESVTLKVPTNWKTLEVTNPATGETALVEVRISSIGSVHILREPVPGAATGSSLHRSLWEGGDWVNAPAPCSSVGPGLWSSQWYWFFWRIREGAGECTKKAKLRIPAFSFANLEFAYELRTQPPVFMSNGVYRGSINYSLGPGADFDMGGLAARDSNLTLNFVVDVQHTLKVEIPPGGTKVSLEPQGGWKSWTEQGRKPPRIFRDQNFYISASSPFKIMVSCQSIAQAECALHASDGSVTSVETLVSLPHGLTLSARPIQRASLQPGVWLGPIQPGRYVDRQFGTLHFEMPKSAIEAVLQPGVSRLYSGYITVIWDSEV